jgi:hypothetical protein
MPVIDLDALLNRLTDWDLQLTVNGKTYTVAPPSNAAVALLEKVQAGQVIAKDIESSLQQVMGPLVGDAEAVKTWSIDQIVGASTAVVLHLRDSLGKNSSGIVAKVKAAMLPPKAPQAPAAAAAASAVSAVEPPEKAPSPAATTSKSQAGHASA